MNADRPFATSSNASTYNEGIDILLLNLLSKQMNFSLDLSMEPVYGWVSGEKRLTERKIDMAIGMYTADLRSYFKLQPTKSYWSNAMYWYVPSGAPAPAWLNVAHVFARRLWAGVALSLLAASALFHLLGRHRPPAEPRLAALHALQVLVWGSSAAWPRGGARRGVVCAWVAGCLVLNAAYQSALVSVLTRPRLRPPVADVDALLRSGLRLALLPPTRAMLALFHDRRYEEVVSRAAPCVALQACMERVARARDTAVPITAAQAAFRMRLSSAPLLARLAEPVLTSRNVLLLAARSPLAPAVDWAVQAAVGAGLLRKRWADLTAPAPAAPAAAAAAGPERIELRDLQGALALWALGLAAASAALLAERCAKWRRGATPAARAEKTAEEKKIAVAMV